MRWSKQGAAELARPELLAEGFNPTDYDYEYRPRFAAERLQPMDACRGEIPYEGPEQWIAWLDAEAAYWAGEGESRDYAAMGRWWLEDPSKAPIVAILDIDGMACVVDGAHRTAIAHGVGRSTVPTVLAIPRERPARRPNPIEWYWDVPPTEPTDVPWADELLADLEPAFADPQMRILLGAETLALLDRLATAPRRAKYFERVSEREIRPVEYPGADPGWYLDTRSGRKVVYEDEIPGAAPHWVRETTFPEGAITVGELVRLEWLLWGAVERAVDLADAGVLDDDQRLAALAIVEAADHLSLRLRLAQMHPDPETAEQIKQSALEILAGLDDEETHLRLLNKRRGFWDRKHDWDEILVSTPNVRLSRGEIRDVYMEHAPRIVDAMRGYDALVLLGLGENKTILRRHGPGGAPIRITKIYGIEDPTALEYWANRRLVELHRVVGAKTDVVWVDLDPKGNGDLRRLVLAITPLVEEIVRRVYPKAEIASWDSGKRGVHVEGYLPRKVDVDAARKKLRAALDEQLGDDTRFTTGIAKPGQIRLDVTTLKRTGSVRTPYTPTIEGRIKRPLPP